MRLDLYQAETERVAAEQMALLEQARRVIEQGLPLSPLEQSGMLHALQVLVENAIGKAKHMLKAAGEPVPVSAYDAFATLVRRGDIPSAQLAAWNAVVGLRNRIVHEYMNVDMQRIHAVVREGRYQFIGDFLRRQPFLTPQNHSDQ